MSYVALYRKFRPDTFEEVKGQDAVVTTLKNQIRTGRIGHAYLFCGTRGTGKTSVAKIFAKAVNCEHPVDGSPCNSCAMCKRIGSGASLNVVEIDAASNNGVDNIRSIVEEVSYRPTEGSYRVYIIDEVHMLSTGAFNALLKTLEEPPAYVIFILATTEAHKIPVTILSRCQRYDFHRIGTDIITARLKDLAAREGIAAEEKALSYIARASEGAMRDALSLLDQCTSFLSNETLTYDKVLEVLGTVDATVFRTLLDALLNGDAPRAIGVFDTAVRDGRDPSQFVTDFVWYLRNVLMVLAAGDKAGEIVDLPTEQLAELLHFADQLPKETIVYFLRSLSELQARLRNASNPRVQIEIELIRLMHPAMKGEENLSFRVLDTERRQEDLLERLALLEEKLASGRFAWQPDEKDFSFDSPEEDAQEESLLPAAPEDLRKVASAWQMIVSKVKDGFAQQMLRSAVPKFDPEETESVLYVEFTNALAQRLPENAELAETLRGIIERTYGITLKIVLRMNFDRGGQLTKIRIDDLIKEQIHFEIEEEE